ncbi:alpha-1,6-mannosyl-glycoprotein 2-beta-N-acetylglucosaminyltransferase-like [Choristoneura fumiferana]|uniref:alpha-1,6-mannosyl-glycoprotein 2-beta-N-acetylglucosaminyltransferase-like n=1 Tax=Choristoneura fumiferana TaxID=7141 RepID=UPI003D159D74
MSMAKDDSMMLEEDYEVRGPALSAEALAARVARLNAERRERNGERWAAPGAAGAVLAVQAGRRAALLQRLLLALAQVEGIEEALLVVSHSFYDDRVNTLVRSVRFCRVLQIFFPHSRQLNPDADCLKRGAGAECAARGARAEHKQHWWWTAHFLFDHCLGNSERLVLFLQEDDCVTRDLLYMLRYAQRALAYHADADVISLGKPWTPEPDFGALTVEPWRPPCERGLAFNRSVWARVAARAALFCAYDDASWSYSLLNVFGALRRGHAGMVASVAPRVLAAPAPAGALFPARVRCVFLAGPGGRAGPRLRAPPHGNGGWDDPRDQLLCLDPFLATTTYSVPYTSTYSSS